MSNRDKVARAAHSGADEAELRRLLLKCKDVNSIGRFTWDNTGALIHESNLIENDTLLCLLLKWPSINIDQRSRHGETALDWAFVCNQPTKVLLLMRAKGQANAYHVAIRLARKGHMISDEIFALFTIHLQQINSEYCLSSACMFETFQKYYWGHKRALTLFKFLRLAGFCLSPDDKMLLIKKGEYDGATFDTLLALSLPEMQIQFAPELKLLNKMRFKLIEPRATEICVALQSLKMDANRLCEIVMAACEPDARELPFYFIWNLVTTVKHFNDGKKEDDWSENAD